MKHLQKYFFGLCLLIIFLLARDDAFAQTKSRIMGTVKDAKTGEMLVGANLQVLGTHLGAVTDITGKYFIIGVPVGTYRVQASMVGYRKKIVTAIDVSADRVATVDLALDPGEIEMNAMVVTADQDVLHKEVSNTQLEVNAEQITEIAGIQQINQFLIKQPGVDENDNGFLTIRGGSADQTGTMVNGISYNNAAVGYAETSIPLSAIDQVTVLQGGFNAEYGNFRSGLINVTTKTGSKEKYQGTFTYQHDFNQMQRFGPALNDPKGLLLSPWLDPNVAFIGTDSAWKNDPYRKQQSLSFSGWNAAAAQYNIGKDPSEQVKTTDLYKVASWMFMTEPDYNWLRAHGETVSDQQKQAFANHIRSEKASNYNFDGGFGGPIPGLTDIGGTFYVSNNTSSEAYTMPVSRPSEKKTTSLATVRLEPSSGTTVNLNGMLKVQNGVSSVRPAFGDFPDANHNGGFMPIDNFKSFVRPTSSISSSGEYPYMYWFDPTFYPLLDQTTWLAGISINHVVNNSTYWELGINYLDIRDNNPSHGDTRDTNIVTWIGQFPMDEMPYGKWQFATKHEIGGYKWDNYDQWPGMTKFRFRSKEGDLYDDTHIGQYRIKFDIGSQLNDVNYVKSGFEYNNLDIDHRYWENWNNNTGNIYEFNYHRKPTQTGLYLQDQISYQWMLANLGVRFDYYYGGGDKWPTGDPFSPAFTAIPGLDSVLTPYLESGRSYIWDYWNAYDSAHPGFLQPVSNFFTISPRVGVSFPLTVDSKFYFNYGQFRSNPPYYSMYMIRYRYKATTNGSNGVYNMPNPNLEPPRTISYELGAAYAAFNAYTLKSSLYYKDVTGQNGNLTYENQDGTLHYTGFQNNVSQDIQGVELSLSKVDNSWITGDINFDYSLTKNDTTGLNYYYDYQVSDQSQIIYNGAESRSLPRPNVSATLSFRTPDAAGEGSSLEQFLGGWKLTLFGEWKAGNYFTWFPLTDPTVENNLQWPDYWMLNLKMNKSFNIGGLRTTLIVECNNLLDLQVNIMNGKFAFDQPNGDLDNYLKSLRLPMYNDPKFDVLRSANPGLFIPGNDKPGDLRSSNKPYINDPNYPYFMYSSPRNVWMSLKVDL